MAKAQKWMTSRNIDWDKRYVGFVEPGRRHIATIAALSPKQFICVVDNTDILIGSRRDLPGQEKPGGEVEFAGRGVPTNTYARKVDTFGR